MNIEKEKSQKKNILKQKYNYKGKVEKGTLNED